MPIAVPTAPDRSGRQASALNSTSTKSTAAIPASTTICRHFQKDARLPTIFASANSAENANGV
jgi:hypothetical protein